MPQTNTLTAKAVANARPADRPYKLADGRQMYLRVQPNGARLWRLDYALHGTRRTLALGAYPDVSLRDARGAADDARALIRKGVDPIQHRRDEAARAEAARGETFQRAVEAMIAERTDWSARHRDSVVQRVSKDLYPRIGARPVGALTAGEVNAALSTVQERGADETARRLAVIVRQVYKTKRVRDLAPGWRDLVMDVGAGLRRAPPKHRRGHFPAVTDPAALADVLAKLDRHEGSPIVGAALKLLPLLWLRPGELVALDWSWVRLEEGMIELPAEAMKGGASHTVPLPRQARALLAELQRITGRGGLVFPGIRSRTDTTADRQRPLSDGTLSKAMRAAMIDNRVQVPHGFRATGRTIATKYLGASAEAAELQLAHVARDPLGGAYNRDDRLDERADMLQRYADFLDAVRAGEAAPRRLRVVA